MRSRNLVKLLGLTALAVVGVMAMNASAAQAKFRLLANKISVTGPLFLVLNQIGSGSLTAANGLKIKCSGGSGSAKATRSASKEKITYEASMSFTGCVWVGSEKTCTIRDAGIGVIKAKGSGELVMEGFSYIATVSGSELATVRTEGAFCTIPEEEVISGSGHALIEFALSDSFSKTATLLNLNLKLGNSSVTSLSAAIEVKHEFGATLGIHLESLSGCEPIC